VELRSQLQRWRLLLPPELQWPDNRRHELSSPPQNAARTVCSFNLDILVAQLRARFYSARFTLESPFLYLALHHPELLSDDDTQHCVSALDSTLLWPLSVASVSEKKRLVPHHFTWTQTAISFLCVFNMIEKNETLKKICEKHLDLRELRISVAVQLSWLQDLKAIDETAGWAWQLLHPLFIGGRESLSTEDQYDQPK
jgi:hypothetical protein